MDRDPGPMWTDVGGWGGQGFSAKEEEGASSYFAAAVVQCKLGLLDDDEGTAAVFQDAAEKIKVKKKGDVGVDACVHTWRQVCGHGAQPPVWMCG